MPRRIDSNGEPEPLDAQVIEGFLSVHIPYRLALLDLAEKVSPAQSIRDSALVEAAIITGRLLLQFLDLGIEHKRGLRLVERRGYHIAKGCTDEVKIPDIGGRFVDMASLDTGNQDILARFHNGASKASAHFTWDSAHDLDLENLRQSIIIIRKLVSTHLPQRGSGT